MDTLVPLSQYAQDRASDVNMSSIGADPLPTTDSTITIQRPSAHTQRYDRQLRLWASSGQSSLEKSRILVIGASALSAQVLKNLVLPGIGSFVLLDDSIVDGADLGVNFFLQPGESKTIQIKLDKYSVGYYDTNLGEEGRWVAEEGAFEVQVGASSKDIR